jgi:predicted ATPase
MHLQLLGGFAVQVGETTIPEAQWKSRRARSLLKLLALAPNHRLHRDQVFDALWPDADLSSAANSLHQTLFAARRVLDPLAPGCLTLDEGYLSLSGGEGQALSVDVDAFEAAAIQAKKAQDPQAYQSALGLYSGELLPEDRYTEWTLQRREALHQTYLELLLNLAHLQESLRDYPGGIDTLLRLLAGDPSHEEAHAGLMRLYASSGRRQQALRQYQTLREVLQSELDAEPSPASHELYEAIQSGQLGTVAPVSLPIASTRHHNLPAQLTSFIGREQEIAEVSRLVSEHRLVTLTGPGGIGKTRLALRAVKGLLETFPDGVFFIELASLSDPALVPQVCAQTLDLVEQPNTPIQAVLAHYLEKKHLLLMLDNCEHVISACTSLADTLLKACPRLHILATSREILSVPGEFPLRVPSLTVPDPIRLPPKDEVAQYEAVRLFVERAYQVSPGIALTEDNLGAVVQICQRLDGIPLALELAAARARMLTFDQIAARLDDSFRLLTGGSRAALPRHQTLKAMIDWSYNQLHAKERLLLQRLSVFAGGWTLEAAEAVCADSNQDHGCREEQIDPLEVMDLLAQLVDKSLVSVNLYEDGSRRYHLLEIIRQYARDHLLEAGCSEGGRDRHLAYYGHLTRQAEPHLRGRGQVEWLDRFDKELDNLRVALEWSLASNVERGLQIMADLMWFWWIRGLFNEGVEWMDKLLKAESAERGAGPLENGRALQRARGLRAFKYLSSFISFLSREDTRAAIEESVAILRRLGSSARRELGISLYNTLVTFETPTLVPEVSQEMLEIFHQENERFYLSEYIWQKNVSAYNLGDMEKAETYAKESLAICREIEDFDGISSRLAKLGEFALFSGDYSKAEALFSEAIEASRKVKNRWWEIVLHEDLLYTAIAQGQYEDAVCLAEAALSSYLELNFRGGIASLLKTRMIIAWAQSDYPQAARLGREVIEGYPDIPASQMIARYYLGRVALAQGDLAQAEDWLQQATSMWSPTYGIVGGYGMAGLVVFLLGWAALYIHQGKMLQAARIMGAIDKIHQCTKMSLSPRERDEHDAAIIAARLALGEEAFAAAWEEGEAMTLEQALAYVRNIV